MKVNFISKLLVEWKVQNYYFQVISVGISFRELGEVLIKKTEDGKWTMTVENTEFNKNDRVGNFNKNARIGYWKESSGDLDSSIIFEYITDSNINTVSRQLSLTKKAINNSKNIEIPALFNNNTFGNVINLQQNRNNVNNANKYSNTVEYISVDPFTYTILV